MPTEWQQAEYEGLLLGLQAAKERGVQRLTVKGDSNLVVKQVRACVCGMTDGLD